jgi:uncharacterized flavoprotein (TIGR03862 family)
MAAEVLARGGCGVDVFDRMPSPARKLLIAGRGGLNLTHSEDFERFVARYGNAPHWLRPTLEAFPPRALMEWAEGLGQSLFIGSSGRVFPKAMKASPLLRAWLASLAEMGVRFHMRHEWRGWDGDALVFDAPDGAVRVQADATVLALGGASWPKLGSNGAWADLLRERGVALSPFSPSNAGLTIAWSDHLSARFAGTPLKNVVLSAAGRTSRGDAVVTRYGLEGGAVYPLAAHVGAALGKGPVTLTLDLRPDMNAEVLARRLEGRARESLANRLRKAGLSALESALLREVHGAAMPKEAGALAEAIKAVALNVLGVQGLARAISSAGGVARDELDEGLMLKRLPGVFAAGEMLDWDAPTGG